MQWGLVLSGGAAHGLCNGGVVEVLDEEGLIPDSIAGSSMGAIIGALHAMRVPIRTMRQLGDSLSLLRIARPSTRMLARGLHGGFLRHNIEGLLQPILGNACIGDCAIPFLCVAGRIRVPIDWKRIVLPGFTDEFLASVEPHVFSPDTRLIDAIMASSAIPVLFSPVAIGSDEFIDLVHFGSIPVRLLREHHHPDRIVATDTTPRHEGFRRVAPHGWREFLDRGHQELSESRACADLMIDPEIPAQLWRFDRALEFMDAGKRAMRLSLPKLRRMIAGVQDQ